MRDGGDRSDDRLFDFKSDGPGLGKGATGVLYVDGKEVARNSMGHTTPITFPEDETFDVSEPLILDQDPT